MKRLPAIFALCALAVMGITALGRDRTPPPILAQGTVSQVHTASIEGR
jgi:hypothetical protein